MKDETLRRELARLTPGDADVEAELQHVQHVARRRRAARRAGAGLLALAVVGAGFLGIPQLMDRIAKQRISTATPPGDPEPDPAPKTPDASAEGLSVMSTALDADAAYVLSGRYSNDYPAPAQLARVDRHTGRVISTQSLPQSGSITKAGDTLWVTQGGMGPGATTDVLALDPGTLAIRNCLSLREAPTLVAGFPDALWVATRQEGPTPGAEMNGLYRVGAATLAITQRLRVAAPVAYLLSDPGGRYFYAALNTPLTVEKRDAVTGSVVASKGDLLSAGGGRLVVSPEGLWVSYPTGMLGDTERLSVTNLETNGRLRPLGDRAFSNASGVVLAKGLLWAYDFEGLWCGDRATGQLRAKVRDRQDFFNYIGDDNALYSVTPAGVTEIQPDAACSASPPPSTAVDATISGPVVKGNPTLMPPSVPQTRTLPVGGDCKALGDQGWTITCDGVVTPDGPVIWLVEHQRGEDPSGQATRAYVFVPQSDTGWRLALQFADDSGYIYFGAVATTVDLPSGLKQVLFGFRMTGTGAVLITDFVSGGSVVASRGGYVDGAGSYDKGVARIGLGKIEFWGSEEGAPDESHCCWSLVRHDVLRYDGRQWRLTSSTTSPRGDGIGPATGTWPDPFLMGYPTR